MSRRQSRRVAGLLRQFQLLGKCFHGDRVFAFVAVRPAQAESGRWMSPCGSPPAGRTSAPTRDETPLHRSCPPGCSDCQGRGGPVLPIEATCPGGRDRAPACRYARVSANSPRASSVYPRSIKPLVASVRLLSRCAALTASAAIALALIAVAHGVVHVAELQRGPDRLVLAGRLRVTSPAIAPAAPWLQAVS